MDRQRCEAIRELLPAHADDGLTPAESVRVSEHLAGCEACRREADEWAALDRVLRAGLSVVEPVSEAEVEAAVARARQARPVWGLAPAPLRFWRAWAPTAALAAAAVLLMVAAGVLPGDTWAEAKQIVTAQAVSIIDAYPTDVSRIVPAEIDAIRTSVSALPETTVAGVARGWDQGLDWSQWLSRRVGTLPLAAGAILLLVANLAIARSVRGSLRPLQGGR